MIKFFFELSEQVLVKIIVFLPFCIGDKLIKRLFGNGPVVEFTAYQIIPEIVIILVGE
jgi:hypothetical protein